MAVIAWHRVRYIDWIIAASVFFLVLLSLLIIYGISINPIAPNAAIFAKQLIFAVLGFLISFALAGTNYRIWITYSKLAYVFCALLLVYVIFFGLSIRGTTGWISLGFITFQPVEFAKIGLLIVLAKYFSDYGRQFFLWRHILASGALTMFYVALVLLQPDLGSAIVLFGTWFLMLLIAGVPRKHLLVLLSGLLVAGALGWMFLFQPYQKDRILTFINPQFDVLGRGYNVRQSIIAVGSGRIFGRGFGLGSQSQLKFLPSAETDFIFAVLAEEFGFIGVIFLLGCFLLILYRLLIAAHRTMDNFAAFFALGLASLLTVQSFINVGMNLGIAPVTGIPLPFMSAGGSSLLAFFIAFGIIGSIVADTRAR